jgi:hypothetical protein
MTACRGCHSPHRLYDAGLCKMVRAGDVRGLRAALVDRATANAHNEQGQTVSHCAAHARRDTPAPVDARLTHAPRPPLPCLAFPAATDPARPPPSALRFLHRFCSC